MRGETARMFLHSCLYRGVSGSACGLFIMIFSKESYIWATWWAGGKDWKLFVMLPAIHTLLFIVVSGQKIETMLFLSTFGQLDYSQQSVWKIWSLIYNCHGITAPDLTEMKWAYWNFAFVSSALSFFASFSAFLCFSSTANIALTTSLSESDLCGYVCNCSSFKECSSFWHVSFITLLIHLLPAKAISFMLLDRLNVKH